MLRQPIGYIWEKSPVLERHEAVADDDDGRFFQPFRVAQFPPDTITGAVIEIDKLMIRARYTHRDHQ